MDRQRGTTPPNPKRHSPFIIYVIRPRVTEPRADQGAATQTLGSGDTLNYNFSSGASQFYGSDAAAIEMEANVWGMWGGDFSQDDDVTSADYMGSMTICCGDRQ